MNKIHVLLIVLSVIACIVIIFQALTWGIVAYQVNRDREDCKKVPLSDLQDSGDYQYCIDLLRGSR